MGTRQRASRIFHRVSRGLFPLDKKKRDCRLAGDPTRSSEWKLRLFILISNILIPPQSNSVIKGMKETASKLILIKRKRKK